jgi:hypothetical protein
VWCGDQDLKVAFLNSFSLTHCKDASVANHLALSSESHHWNVNFLIAAHDWEVDSFTSFFNFLYSLRLR